jgi:hypothetical protein
MPNELFLTHALLLEGSHMSANCVKRMRFYVCVHPVESIRNIPSVNGQKFLAIDVIIQILLLLLLMTPDD